MSSINFGEFFQNLIDIGNKVTYISNKVYSYLVSLTALATAISNSIDQGGKDLAVLQTYFNQIATKVNEFISTAKTELEAGSPVIVSMETEIDSLIAEAMKIVHEMGIMSDKDYATLLASFKTLVTESDTLEANMQTASSVSTSSSTSTSNS
jgi:urocanate hydratase